MIRKFICLFVLLLPSLASADRLILKDGREISGKVIYTSDQIIVISNPLADPVEQTILVSDVATIVHEPFRLPSPDERRKGFAMEARVTGNFFSSNDAQPLTLHSSPGLYIGGGARLTPLFELNGGLNWVPVVGSNGFEVDVTDKDNKIIQSRRYEQFALFRPQITGRIYPFYMKRSWPVEPYLFGGYCWSRLEPKDSGDALTGSGWLVGTGVLRRLTKHLYLDAQFQYDSMGYDEIQFSGQTSPLSPGVNEKEYTLSLGISYRI
jgi:hypothetical protein